MREKKLQKFLMPKLVAPTGTLTAAGGSMLSEPLVQVPLPRPGERPGHEDYDGGTLYVGVWEEGGLFYVNANAASWDKKYFAGTPWELSWGGSAASVVLGKPLEHNSRDIMFAGGPVEVGYDASGAYETNVRVTRNGATLVVNEVSVNANGIRCTGLHLIVPGVGEAWFNDIDITF